MADPLNQRLDNEALIQRILQQHPSLTREKIIEMADLFGFDLAPQPVTSFPDRSRTRSS
jgi:hypothetical protein